MIKKPILFIIFNRPETTKKVFEAIRQSRPPTLFVAADGPRENKIGEKELCNETRKIVEKIDWPCEVKTLFREKNLGCKIGVSSAINWFFQHVEGGIILEDDCVPDQSFFVFCEEMLEKYKNNYEIMHINGTNFQFGNKRGNASYYFSRCPSVWGWATWKRAWAKYDINMKYLEEYSKTKKIYKLFKSRVVGDFWISLFRHIIKKNIDTWDAQWAYSVMRSNGIAITPNTNLIENIGFGEDATHTKKNDNICMQKSNNIDNIIHPTNILVDQDADDYLAKKMYIRSLFKKIMDKISILS